MDKGITLAGDGRYDGPGFSTNYCANIIMETCIGLIIGYTLLSKEDGKYLQHWSLWKQRVA